MIMAEGGEQGGEGGKNCIMQLQKAKTETAKTETDTTYLRILE